MTTVDKMDVRIGGRSDTPSTMLTAMSNPSMAYIERSRRPRVGLHIIRRYAGYIMLKDDKTKQFVTDILQDG